MSDDVQVQFGAETSKLDDGVSHVKQQIQSLGETMSHLGDLAKQIAGALGAAFSVDAVADLISKMAELGEQVERTSAILGISTESTQELGYIAAVTGGSAEGLAMSLERLQLNLSRAQAGTGPAAEALRALGLSAKQLIGIPIDEQMNRIADAVSRFGDGGNKTAIVMALLGRSGAQMIPVLDQGRAGLEELRQTAENAGAVMSHETVTALAGLEKSFVTLKSAVTGAAGTLVGTMAPALTSFSNGLATLVGNISVAIQTHTLWERELVALSTGAQELAQALKNLGQVAYDVFSLNWGKIAADRAAGLDRVAEIQREGDAKINEIARRAQQEFQQILSGNGGTESSKPQAPAMDTANQVAAAQKAIDAQMKAWEQWLAQQKILYDEDAKTFSITQDQKYALTIAATDKAYKAELGLLQQEEQLGGLSVAQRAAVLARISELEAKHNTDLVKLNAQSVASMQKQYEDFFNTIEGAFNSQLRGLLAGTTSWATAFKNIMADLVVKFIEDVEKMVLNWVSGELAKTTATTAGTAARTAAGAAGDSASLLSVIGNALKAVFAGAGQTAAGVSANVAPVAGPAAPAIGAAAGAAVLGEALPLIPHAIGSWEVPNVTPALLHPGEMVIPKPFAEGIRENAGALGGGVHSNFTIHAVDSQSVARLLTDNAHHVVKAVNEGIKRGAHLGLR